MMTPKKDLISYFPSKVLPALIGLITSSIVINSFSVIQYGKYQLIISTAALISGFCFPWINSIILRYSNLYKRESLIYSLLPFWVFSFALGSIVWIYYSKVIYYELTGFMVTGICWLTSNALFETFILLLRIDNKHWKYTVVVSLKSLLFLFASLLLYYNLINSIKELIVIQLIGLLFVNVYSLKGYKISGYERIHNDNICALIRYGLPTIGISFFTLIQGWLGKLIISEHLGLGAVGIYAANWDYAEKIFVVLNSVFILASSASIISEYDNRGMENSVNYLSKVLSLYIRVTPVIFAIFIFLYPFLSSLFLPEEYVKGLLVFPLVAIGVFIIGIIHRYSLLLTLINRNDLVMLSMGLSVLSFILALFIFLPLVGLLSGGLAYIAAQVIYLISVLYFTKSLERPEWPSYTFEDSLLILLVILSFGSYILNMNSWLLFLFSLFFISILCVYSYRFYKALNVASE